MMLTIGGLVFAAALPVSGQGEPLKVWRTVNAQGVVEFSDTPPPEGVAAEQLDMPALQPVDPLQSRANLEALRETTDRLAAERRARELPRSPIVVLEAAPAREPTPPDAETLRQGIYFPPIYYPVRRPPHHPHPPLQPLAMPDRDRNSQLMRPITEQRLREREARRRDD